MGVQVATEPFRLAVTDAALEQRIRDGLGRVEDLLREAASSDHPFIGQTANHLVDAGGKRFRPLLTLLAAEFGDFAAPGVVPAAAVVELTHLATLYHDDVMDEAPLRRGVPTANARWDNSIAILTGDFLFARASQILADLGPEAVRLQAETFERLVAGQINECIGPKDGQAPIDHYLSVLVDKTGSLIATSARFGALLSGAPGPVVDTLTRFGEVFGVAFQLSDDVLDIASDSDQSGKTPGTDLREGVPTLPTLYALASTDRESARLRELLSAPITDDALVREVLADLRVHPSIDQARQTVARYADEACELLESLPDNAAKETLLALCEIVGSRTV
ncbi:polyprenyl synthetase family protein [Actinocrinis puniceicyclus]|uniref:polyprenyl synthetase family protein n=1 Tax=Actinocrinis puniceicyclus TaxID=977794 RepID=UPI0028A670DF|nr:polyprenyl synthetase family protein [Actinocrinis puniceicyclus]